MPFTRPLGHAFNRTRGTEVAARVAVANTHWSRFRGLMGRAETGFLPGDGLWIIPSRGVHTFAMNFPIDVIYLDARSSVVHMEENLRPWRLGRVHFRAHSVLEVPANTVRATGTTIGDAIEIVPAGGGSRTSA